MHAIHTSWPALGRPSTTCARERAGAGASRRISARSAASVAPAKAWMAGPSPATTAPSPLAQVPERHRVPQRLHLRDRVLPVAAGGAGEGVGRARGEGQRAALPGRARLRGGLAAQAEDAWREERDADHLAEDRAVLVPADAGAGAVFGQQHLLQRGGLEAGEGGGALAQGQEERWDVLGRLDLHQVEIVAPAERDDAALAEEALELEGAERQLGETVDERLLRRGRDELRRVEHAVRVVGVRSKRAASMSARTAVRAEGSAPPPSSPGGLSD